MSYLSINPDYLDLEAETNCQRQKQTLAIIKQLQLKKHILKNHTFYEPLNYRHDCSARLFMQKTMIMVIGTKGLEATYHQ